jgi:hypothetical protein
MSHGTRIKQYMMHVEVKTCGADCTEKDSQYDTLMMYHETLSGSRARKQAAETGRFVNGGDTMARRVYSPYLQRRVVLCFLGWNLLQMSGHCPKSSEVLSWNRRPIGYDLLRQIMRLDIHPRTFAPLTGRRHKAEKQRPLFESIGEETHARRTDPRL